jgi:hypothetical protein
MPIRHLMREQPLTVLGEGGRVERRLVDAHVQEPFDVMKERGLRSP